MPAREGQSAGRPFGEHDYEIVFRPLDVPREVDIGAKAAEPLRVGDILTVGRAGCLYDLTVQAISRHEGGGWNARCTISDLHWI